MAIPRNLEEGLSFYINILQCFLVWIHKEVFRHYSLKNKPINQRFQSAVDVCCANVWSITMVLLMAKLFKG